MNERNKTEYSGLVHVASARTEAMLIKGISEPHRSEQVYWETLVQMHTTMKILAVAVVATTAWGVTQSFAGGGDDCKSYAQKSAKQQDVNVAKSCNKTGTYWTKNTNVHMQYCESVPPQIWKAALKKRYNELKACN